MDYHFGKMLEDKGLEYIDSFYPSEDVFVLSDIKFPASDYQNACTIDEIAADGQWDVWAAYNGDDITRVLIAAGDYNGQIPCQYGPMPYIADGPIALMGKWDYEDLQQDVEYQSDIIDEMERGIYVGEEGICVDVSSNADSTLKTYIERNYDGVVAIIIELPGGYRYRHDWTDAYSAAL